MKTFCYTALTLIRGALMGAAFLMFLPLIGFALTFHAIGLAAWKKIKDAEVGKVDALTLE